MGGALPRKRRLLNITIFGGTLAAAACSVAATVSTQLLKSQNIEENVARAQSCRAKLEVLEVGLTTGHIDTSQATSEFIRCVEEVSFLDAR